MLELAAGPGDTGFLAAARLAPDGRLLSTDIAPEMLVAARRRAAELGLANVEFRVMDAQKLDLADASVDGVLCRWGYMLVDDPAQAFAETRRVLQARRPGRVRRVGERGREPMGVVDRPSAAGAGWSSGPDRTRRALSGWPSRSGCEALVEGAGLELLALEDVALTWRYESFDEYWEVSSDLSRTLAVALGVARRGRGGTAVRERHPSGARAVRARARPRDSGAGARRAGAATALRVRGSSCRARWRRARRPSGR